MIERAMCWKSGGCHCGAVRFEVLVPDDAEFVECNCSICRMTGYRHLIVEKERFRLLSGAEKIATYTFNTGTARHHFCAICGIKSFYVPRSHPDGVSVNARCLDEGAAKPRYGGLFDGRNWEAQMAMLNASDDRAPGERT